MMRRYFEVGQTSSPGRAAGSSSVSRVVCLLLTLFLTPLAFCRPVLAEEPLSGTPQPGDRTIERRFDTVIVRGERLGPLQGEPISALRLYAFGQGILKPITFQIDERDAEGEFVFTSGPNPTRDVDGELFDYNDELLFMIQEAGDQLPGDCPELEGLKKWSEIQVSDPLAPGKKAWVYLCSFAGKVPPLVVHDYIRYVPETEQIFSDYYGLGYRKGMSLYTDLFYPDGKGGYGPDLLDRIKVRIRLKFLFSLIRVSKSEEDFGAKVVSWKDGPIRVLRNVESYVRVLFNISSPSVFAVTEYYPHYMYTPLRITVPFDLDWVFSKFGISDWYWYFYGDLPGLEGGRMYTNKNLEGVPISTEKTKDWYEKNMDTQYLVWGYATKEGAGTWFCNMVIPDMVYQFCECYLNIDKSGKYAPEDVRGEVAGGVLLNFSKVDSFLWKYIGTGTYEIGLETFFPQGAFKPEGVEEWRNIREFPIRTEVTRMEDSGRRVAVETVQEGGTVKLDPAVSRQRGTTAIATDIEGRKIVIYGATAHIGSIRSSERSFMIGQDLKTRKWYKIEFTDLERIEQRLIPEEPVTGMKRPLIGRVTTKAGQVHDLVSCKPCTLSGYLADGRRVGYQFTEIETMEFLEPDEVAAIAARAAP